MATYPICLNLSPEIGYRDFQKMARYNHYDLDDMRDEVASRRVV